jgi:ABC-2 type transport system permease protein
MPAEGVIHDLGYQRYAGPRNGRAQIVRALTWHSFRAAFGMGRGARAKIVPIIAFIAICLPAVINAVAVAKGNQRLFSYDTYVPALRIIVLTLFVAVQAPELVSRDLRSRVLPLYFARPLHRADYPLAKYLALTGACAVLVEIPLLVLYLGTISSLHGGAAVWAQTRALIPGLLIGALWAIVIAATGLLLASVSGRRGYATGAVAIFFFLTWTVASIIIQAEGGSGFAPGRALTVARIGGLLSPFTLLDGVRFWLAGSNGTQGQVPYPGDFGIVYLLVLLALLAGSLGGLVARYRRAGL